MLFLRSLANVRRRRRSLHTLRRCQLPWSGGNRAWTTFNSACHTVQVSGARCKSSLDLVQPRVPHTHSTLLSYNNQTFAQTFNSDKVGSLRDPTLTLQAEFGPSFKKFRACYSIRDCIPKARLGLAKGSSSINSTLKSDQQFDFSSLKLRSDRPSKLS